MYHVTMDKRHDLILKKYHKLPQMSQRQITGELNVSQNLLTRIVNGRHEFENASLANESLDHN